MCSSDLNNEKDARLLTDIRNNIDRAKVFGDQVDRLNGQIYWMKQASPQAALVRAKEKERDKYVEKRNLAYGKAAHLTIEAYDLNPDLRT